MSKTAVPAPTCPVSYCDNQMDRFETMVCTACIRRCPTSLRRDVYLANNAPEKLGAIDGIDGPVLDNVGDRVMAYLENHPRGVPRRRGRPHRKSTR